MARQMLDAARPVKGVLPAACRDPRWIAAGIGALLVAALGWGLFGPEPPLVVSRETTFVTAPLAADGLPDYEAALLAAYGPAPPPEENAAAVLLQTCWPFLADGATHMPVICKAVGIPNAIPAAPLDLDPANAATGIDQAMLDAAERSPWTKEDLPQVAAWLAENESGIDRLVAAADRPHYWLPSPSLLDGHAEMLLGSLLADGRQPRQVGRLLLYRALWHVGEGRPAAAWRDVTAIRRFARLLAPPGRRGAWLITQLQALAVDRTADEATRHLLAMPDLPAELLATIRRDLEGLGPPVSLADAVASRFRGIDTGVWLARRAPGGRGERAGLIVHYEGVVIPSGSSPVTGSMPVRLGFSPAPFARENLPLLTSLDWNVVLERVNDHYDDLESALGQPTHATRQAALENLERVFAGRVRARDRSAWSVAGDFLLQACSRRYRSDRVADWLLISLRNDGQQRSDIGLANSVKVSTLSDAQLALTKTAAALAAWRADRGPGAPPYPERLDELVPTYLAAVPIDPFSEKPFVYERRGDGYLLASVGRNGVYDGGDDISGWIRGGEWQAQEQDWTDASDHVVRMPFPPRPAVVAPAP